MKLIFALGNPGLSYKYTYHSVGLLLSDYLISNNVVLDKKERAMSVYYRLGEYNILQSRVYMNNSFSALRDFYTYFKLTPSDILVLHDELSLPRYTFRLKFTEGLGGHNGLRDIAKNIGPNFAKLRIGIDHPKNFNPHLDVSSYVLSKLDFDEWSKHFQDGVSEIDKWNNHSMIVSDV